MTSHQSDDPDAVRVLLSLCTLPTQPQRTLKVALATPSPAPPPPVPSTPRKRPHSPSADIAAADAHLLKPRRMQFDSDSSSNGGPGMESRRPSISSSQAPSSRRTSIASTTRHMESDGGASSPDLLGSDTESEVDEDDAARRVMQARILSPLPPHALQQTTVVPATLLAAPPPPSPRRAPGSQPVMATLLSVPRPSPLPVALTAVLPVRAAPAVAAPSKPTPAVVVKAGLAERARPAVALPAVTLPANRRSAPPMRAQMASTSVQKEEPVAAPTTALTGPPVSDDLSFRPLGSQPLHVRARYSRANCCRHVVLAYSIFQNQQAREHPEAASQWPPADPLAPAWRLRQRDAAAQLEAANQTSSSFPSPFSVLTTMVAASQHVPSHSAFQPTQSTLAPVLTGLQPASLVSAAPVARAVAWPAGARQERRASMPQERSVAASTRQLPTQTPPARRMSAASVLHYAPLPPVHPPILNTNLFAPPLHNSYAMPGLYFPVRPAGLVSHMPFVPPALFGPPYSAQLPFPFPLEACPRLAPLSASNTQLSNPSAAAATMHARTASGSG